MKYSDIPQFPRANYEVNVSWSYLKDWLSTFPLVDMDPDFQRGHVWTREQQIMYVEYILKGGEASRILYWNHPSWDFPKMDDSMSLVDGKQRITAVLAFLDNKIPAFGHLYSSFEGSLRVSGPDFRMRVSKLTSKKDLLEWYLGINSGGTPHSQSEIDRIRSLLQAEKV